MGCTFLPSVLIIATYFNKRRGIATGIALAGGGVGAFVFAPLTEYLLTKFDWKITNMFIGALVAQCCIFGAFMKPLAKLKVQKQQ